MEINKKELKLMLKEYWNINNNEYCERMTIIFLQKNNFTQKEIRNILRKEPQNWAQPKPEDLQEYEGSIWRQ